MDTWAKGQSGIACDLIMPFRQVRNLRRIHYFWNFLHDIFGLLVTGSKIVDKGENAERPGSPGLGMERAVRGSWEQAHSALFWLFSCRVAQGGDQEVAGECGATPVAGRMRPPL